MRNLKYLSISLVFFTSAACAQSGDAASVAEMESLDAPVSAPVIGSYSDKIVAMAGSSSCAKYSWKNRGKAPLGYTKGVALGFARTLCRLKQNGPLDRPAEIMSMADTRNASKDVLTHYSSILRDLNIPVNKPGNDTMRGLASIVTGLGLRESSGKYCEGWDKAAGSNRPSAAGEAGLYQFSYDSIGVNIELRNLYNEYQANPNRCMLAVFKEGASCKPQGLLGTGAGADFQQFTKSCPAFAVEYVMVLLRLQRTHFGPINRREAEVRSECNSLLKNVQQLVESDPVTACRELF